MASIGKIIKDYIDKGSYKSKILKLLNDAFDSLVNRDELSSVATSGDYDDLTNKPTYALGEVAGGAAVKATSIPYGECDGTSTATVFTATIDGITELRNGVCFLLKNGVITSASGFTVNINNLGAKPVYNNLAAATRDTTLFNVNYTMLFIYDEDRVEGGCFICYRGYDSNSNTIGYQLRTNSQSLPMTEKVYRYRLLFTSADGTHYVPANTSTSTNATTARTPNQTPINPFGAIFYYGYTTVVNAGSMPATTRLWSRYTITLGYSFNNAGGTLNLVTWKPVYIKCAPQTNGSTIIDSTNPYVQDLPNTDDGNIYIFLGIAYSNIAVEMFDYHPVYYYKDGAIRIWTNTPAPTLPTLATVATTGNYNDLVNKPYKKIVAGTDKLIAHKAIPWGARVNTRYFFTKYITFSLSVEQFYNYFGYYWEDDVESAYQDVSNEFGWLNDEYPDVNYSIEIFKGFQKPFQERAYCIITLRTVFSYSAHFVTITKDAGADNIPIFRRFNITNITFDRSDFYNAYSYNHTNGKLHDLNTNIKFASPYYQFTASETMPFLRAGYNKAYVYVDYNNAQFKKLEVPKPKGIIYRYKHSYKERALNENKLRKDGRYFKCTKSKDVQRRCYRHRIKIQCTRNHLKSIRYTRFKCSWKGKDGQYPAFIYDGIE